MQAPEGLPSPRPSCDEMAGVLPSDVSESLDEAIVASPGLPQLLEHILALVSQILGAVHVSFYWLEHRTQRLMLKAIHHKPGDAASFHVPQRLPLSGTHLVAQATRTKQPLLRTDRDHPEDPPDVQHLTLDPDSGLALALPVFANAGKAVLGVLYVTSTTPEMFAPQQLGLLTALARRAGRALHQAHVLEATRVLSHKMIAPDHDATLAYIVEALADLLYVPVCSLWLADRVTGELTLRHATGRPESSSAAPAIRLPRQSFLGQALETGQPVRSSNVQQETVFLHRSLAQEQHWSSALAVPIPSTDAQPQSVLAVYAVDAERVFTEVESNLAMSWAQQVAPILQHVSVQHTLDVRAQRREKQLQTVNAILSQSVVSKDVNELLQYAAAEISETFGYLVDLGLVEQQEVVFKATAASNFKLSEKNPTRLPLGTGFTGTVASTGHPIIVSDVTQNPLHHPSSPDTRSELVVPLLTATRECIGVLNLESKALCDFSQEDIPIFEAIAANIVLVIEEARQRKELSVLYHVLEAVNCVEEFDQLLGTIVNTVVEFFNADASIFFMASPDTQYLTLVHAFGLSESMQEQRRTLKRGQSIAGKVLASGKTIFVEDLATDDRVDKTLHFDADFHSLIDVPIKTDDRILGVLAIATKHLRLFTQHDADLLEAIGLHMSGVIRRLGLHQEIAQVGSRYRHLYESAQDPIIMMDGNGIITQANDATVRVSGYALHELRGMKMAELIADADRKRRALERIDCATGGAAAPVMEFPLQHKDRSLFFVESSLTPIIDDAGQVLGIQCIWRDVTARKQADAKIQRHSQQLEALLDMSRVAFRSVGRRALLAQAAREAMQSLASDGCYIHLREDDSETMHPFVYPSILTLHQRWPGPVTLGSGIIGRVAITGQGRRANNVHTYAGDDALPVGYRSEIRPQHLLSQPLKSNEKVIGVISVTRWGGGAKIPYSQEDETGLEHLGNILTLALEYIRLTAMHHQQRAAQKVLEQVSMVGTFLGHKMGGFLGAMALTAQGLASKVSPNDQDSRELLDNFLAGSRMATHLLSQFRSMGKPLHQQPQDRISLALLLKTALQRVSVPTRIHVQCEDLTALPSVKASESMILEVFEGIIRNAIDAMPAFGTLAIRSSVTCDRYTIRLSLADTGEGMFESTVKELFTPFFTTKKNRGGMGIGLWLSRLYLQAIGGDIEVQSARGHGTTFTVCLPAMQTALPVFESTEETAVQDHTLARPLKGTPATPGTPRVLVVDDDPFWRGSLPPLLRQQGMEVHIASNHDEAVYALRQMSPFSAFVFDIRLEDHNAHNFKGLQLVGQILDRIPSALVVILSGWPAQLEVAHERFGGRENVHILHKTDENNIEAVIAFLGNLVQPVIP